MENNVGFARIVGTLSDGEIKLQRTPKSRYGLNAGLLKVIRPDSWQTKATIAQGSFIV